jgi:hypothetical protein
VCYLAQAFKPLMQMSELQQELLGAGGDDAEVRREAERELEALGRKTDTWLAIFQVCPSLSSLSFSTRTDNFLLYFTQGMLETEHHVQHRGEKGLH